MSKQKQIQIPEELFLKIAQLAIHYDGECDDWTDQLIREIRDGVEAKLERISQRNLYTQYKSAGDEETRQNALRDYLAKKGAALE